MKHSKENLIAAISRYVSGSDPWNDYEKAAKSLNRTDAIGDGANGRYWTRYDVANLLGKTLVKPVRPLASLIGLLPVAPVAPVAVKKVSK